MFRSAERERAPASPTVARRRASGALFVLLILLELLVVDAARPLGYSSAQAATAQTCASLGHSGDAPERRGDHSQCCLLCEWRARADAALFDPFGAEALRSGPSRTSPAPPQSDKRRRRPVGWTSSWSSRAPPVFS